MRTAGLLMLAVSGVLAGLSRVSEIRKCERLMRSVMDAMEILRYEISERHTPICDAVYIISKDKQLDAFCSSVLAYMNCGREGSFSEYWSNAVRKELGILPSDCLDALISLSPVLGRYDAALQSESIDRCIRLLGSRYLQMRSAQRDREKLCIGVCGATTVIAAILLL